MNSPRSPEVPPALLVLALLPLLTAIACNSTTATASPFLLAVTLAPETAPSIPVAATVQVDATGTYQDSPTKLTDKIVTSSARWSTSNPLVATVNNGLVTGTGIGSATISARFDGKMGTTLVVVGQTATLVIAPTGTGSYSLSTNPDQHFDASASYSDGSMLDLTRYATWVSSAPLVLMFYDPTDYLHGPGDALLLATGTSTITATLDTGEVGSLDVTVVP